MEKLTLRATITGRNAAWGLIMLAAAMGLYWGWKTFWFLTDDAFIAFRYVSNSILGYGYVWNAPPFRPVEGYTSFLWVVVLDLIWRIFGIEPPQAANNLSLVLSYLTLLLVAGAAARMELGNLLNRYRPILVGLILVGTLTNRTFLAWTSSGLETALFNFCFSLWMVIVVLGRRQGNGWLWSLSFSMAAVYLTRPDGLLVALATLAILAHYFWSAYQRGDKLAGRLVAITPILIAPLHLGWRWATYGEWLPNTYYAKHVAAWPEAGIRYLAAFVLEYTLWIWVAAFVLFLAFWVRKRLAQKGGLWAIVTNPDTASAKQFGLLVVVATVIGHLAYYTLIIGGDHFEFRVYSYLVPWIFLSFVWMVNKLDPDPVVVAASLGLFILLSWPLQWTHWTETEKRQTRDETWIMVVPIATEFPTWIQGYVGWYDELQDWLIHRHVCMRHQEHKTFYNHLVARYSPRSMEKPPQIGNFPIMSAHSVGIPAWTLPHVAILDRWGLNDYVIARHKAVPREFRFMAHDRFPPEGYTESFSINYGLLPNGTSGFIKREWDITAEDIAATETFWIDRIINGSEAPLPYAMLNRIGESLIRKWERDSAIVFLEQALTLDTTTARAYINLALCNQHRPDSAIALLERAVVWHPEDPLLLVRLGEAYLDLGYDRFETDQESGRAVFQKGEGYLLGVLSGPTHPTEPLIDLASMHLFLSQIDSSVSFLTILEQQRDHIPGALVLLGDRYTARQFTGLAMRAYGLAIQCGLNSVVTNKLVKRYPALGAYHR